MSRRLRIWTWPNALSLARLPLAVAFPLITSMPGRGALLALAAAADVLDGRIARRYHQDSRVGEVLDPIADKAFVGTAMVTFLAEGSLSVAQVAVLLARDVYCVLGWLALIARSGLPRLPSRRPGKLVTVLQLATLVLVLAAPAAVNVAVMVMLPIAAWAIVDYTRAALRSLRHAGGAP